MGCPSQSGQSAFKLRCQNRISPGGTPIHNQASTWAKTSPLSHFHANIHGLRREKLRNGDASLRSKTSSSRPVKATGKRATLFDQLAKTPSALYERIMGTYVEL